MHKKNLKICKKRHHIRFVFNLYFKPIKHRHRFNTLTNDGKNRGFENHRNNKQLIEFFQEKDLYLIYSFP